MSQTFIAGFDGSDASRAAVRFAVELAAVQHAEVLAAHVYPRLAPAGMRGGTFDPEMQETVRDAAREVLEALDVEGVGRRMIVAGSPAQALHDLAEEESAALLALGVTRRGRARRVVPGSVASNLLHGAPCPVVVVPADTEPGPIRTIAVAVDDGAQAREALRVAADLARAFGAGLRVIAAYEREVFAGPATIAAHDLDRMLRGDLTERVEALAADIDDVEVDIRVAAGSAGKTISRSAADADLLVTGSRGYGPRRSVLVGGVSRYLVDNAPCPVMVVPRTDDGATEPLATVEQGHAAGGD